jgi:nucleoid-associated protein YgaU
MGRASLARSGAVWSTATVVALALLVWLRPDRAVAARPGSLEEALAQGGALTAATCVVWLWCVTTLAVGEAVDLRSPAAAPRSLVSRLVLVACGVALSGAVTVPAHAEPHPARDPQRHATVGALHGLALPDRPTGGDSAGAVVVVRAGDTLWSVARGLLPNGAGDAAINALWRRIHAANLDVVGADPDRIRPGQRLVVPEVAR